VPVRWTAIPSRVVRGAAPGHPEQTSRTRCPRAASRPKI
jgi:hypothetical protein